jgi:hypothetical protein
MLNKQKALFAAVTGAIAGLSGSAQAVIQGNGGLGSYLNYPYYTVKGGNDSLMSVVNSTASAKVVKVRYFDAKNTREVLDFNLFLSPFDVWTGIITKNGTTGGGLLKTNDNSCTVPSIPATGVAFRNALLNEVDFDGNIIDNSIARTEEGYMEIIEMATLDPLATANLPRTNAAGSINASGAATHVAGVPRDCGSLVSLYSSATTTSALAPVHMLPPSGGLFGGASIVNVAAGTDVTYDANAYNQTYAGPNHFAPASTLPNVGSMDPNACIISNQGDVYCGLFGAGNSLTATMMRSSASAEWITDPSIGGGTDIVLNFPTKNLYVPSGNICVGGSGSNPPGVAPFTSNFCRPAPGSAPETVVISAYDREERTSVQQLDFSPTTTAGNPTLPYEAQVVTIGQSNVLGSNQSRNVNPPVGTTGWIKFDFTSLAAPARTLTSALGATRNGTACGAITLRGLPVTGFAVQKFANGNVGGILSNYGGNFALKTDISVTCQ